MSEAFKLVPSPDGGMQLQLNLARTAFVVSISPAELSAIKERVTKWHTNMHRQTGSVSGDPEPYVRREMMGVLMRRMAEVTPSGLMGAVAKKQLKKRVTVRATRPVARKPAPKKSPPGPRPDPKKILAVQNALKIVAGRRASFLAQSQRKALRPNTTEIAAGKNFARAHFKKYNLPTTNAPNAFWAQPLPTIQAKAQTAIKLAESQGAPVPAKPAPKIDRRKLQIVQNALRVLSARRARMIAYEKRKTNKPTAAESKQAEAFAQEFFTKEKIPTTSAPGPFWGATALAIKQKADAALKKAETLGAPKVLPKPFRLERTKLLAVQRGGKLLATRRAKYLAWQRKARVTATDMKTGQVFAKDFLLKNGIPSTDAPHQFWTQPLPIIQTKVNAVVQLAEAQGAPAKPPTPAVTKPIVTRVPATKIAVIKRGLQELAGRRARYLAWQRKAKVTSAADIEAGKQWARQQFVKKGIPVTMPGGKTNIAGDSDLVVLGWMAPASVMGASGAMTRAKQLAPKVTDAQAARSALGLARKQLNEGKSLVTKKFGGVLSRMTGEHQAAMSLVNQNLSYVDRVEKMVPPSGPVTDSKVRNAVALAIVQSGDALSLIDRLEATTFANILSSGVKSLFGAIGTGLAFVVDAVSAFWSQPEPVIRQRVEDVLRETNKDAPMTLPANAPAVVPPPPGALPPDVEKKRLIVADGFKLAVNKWKEQLAAMQMSAPEQVIINGVAAHFRANGIPIDRPNPTEPFWKQDQSVIVKKVAAAVDTVRAVAGRPAPAPVPVPGQLPPDAPPAGTFSQADEGVAPGDMPPESPYVPGEIPEPASEFDVPVPGDLPVSAESEYPPGQMEEPGIPGSDPYGEVVPPGEISEPITADASPFTESPGEIPGQMPAIDEPMPEIESLETASEEFSETVPTDEPAPESYGELPSEYAVSEYPEAEMPPEYPETEMPSEYPGAEESQEEYPLSAEEFAPMEEIPEFSTEMPTEMPTEFPMQEEVTGMYEIGAAKPRKITKQKYEQLVRNTAARHAANLQARFRGNAKLLHDAKKRPIQEAIWARAKKRVDDMLKKKNVTVAGAYMLGVSDIMGASYVLGQAESGNPEAIGMIAMAKRMAHAGHPAAKRDVTALKIASRKRRRRRRASRPRGVAFPAQEAVYNWPAQRRAFTR